MKIPLALAETISIWSNWALLASLVVGACSTGLVIWMGNIKESELKLSLSSAHVSAEAAKAEAAIANKIAAEANLELAKFKAPRTLNDEQKKRISEKLKPFSGQKFSGLVASSVFDARSLWESLVSALISADWILSDPKGLALGNPPAGVPIDPEVGVTIIVREDLYDELGPQAQALAKALIEEGIETKITMFNKSLDHDKIVIEIGMKP